MAVETPEFADMVERLVRRYGVRVGDADPVDLTRMLEVRAVFDEAIGLAVRGLHRAGYSWRELGEAIGTTREAAFMRYRDTVSSGRGPFGVVADRAWQGRAGPYHPAYG